MFRALNSTHPARAATFPTAALRSCVPSVVTVSSFPCLAPPPPGAHPHSLAPSRPALRLRLPSDVHRDPPGLPRQHQRRDYQRQLRCSLPAARRDTRLRRPSSHDLPQCSARHCPTSFASPEDLVRGWCIRAFERWYARSPYNGRLLESNTMEKSWA